MLDDLTEQMINRILFFKKEEQRYFWLSIVVTVVVWVGYLTLTYLGYRNFIQHGGFKNPPSMDDFKIGMVIAIIVGLFNELIRHFGIHLKRDRARSAIQSYQSLLKSLQKASDFDEENVQKFKNSLSVLDDIYY